VSALVLGAVAILGTLPSGATTIPPAATSPVESAIGVPANSTYCGLLGEYAEAGPEPYTTQFFARLCVEPAFITLVSAWGGLRNSYPNNGTEAVLVAVNLSLGTSSDASMTDVYFQIAWTSGLSCAGYSAPCAHEAVWVGNDGTGSLSGPTLETSPDICGCLPFTYPAYGPFGPWGIAGLLGTVVAASAVAAYLSVRARRTRPPPEAAQPPAPLPDPPRTPP
jgi:hypothetical protein